MLREATPSAVATTSKNASANESEEEMPPQQRDESARDAKEVYCHFCLGVSVYKKAMAQSRQPPQCRGIEIRAPTTEDYLDEIERRAGKVRPDNFSLYGMGVSIYSPERMAAQPRRPVVRGLGLVVVQSDPDELMRRIEQRKRVKRELDKARRGVLAGDDDDEYDDEYDDDDLIEDRGDDEDGAASRLPDDTPDADGAALVEKRPLGAMPSKPRMPPVLPTMSFEEVMSKSAENAKAMTHAMYNFWAKRLDGFGERYQESCRRIFAQMDKQVKAVPNSIAWAQREIKELEEQVRRGGGDDNGPEKK